MLIKQYRFGQIDIDDKAYNSDVIISGQEVINAAWWRQQGHSLAIDDLQQIIDYKPEILVIGTGYYGRLQIPAETKRYLSSLDIRLIDRKTSEAVAQFKQLQAECARIIAALHLTC